MTRDCFRHKGASRDRLERYILTAKSHWNQAWPIVVHSLILIIGPLYFYYEFGEEELAFGITFSAIAFLVVLLPHLAIHLRYTALSRGVTVLIDRKSRKLVYEKRGNMLTLHSNNTASVVNVMPRAMANASVLRWFPWDNYNYLIVETIDGERIILTSLLMPKVELPFRVKNEVKRKTVYSWPRF